MIQGHIQPRSGGMSSKWEIYAGDPSIPVVGADYSGPERCNYGEIRRGHIREWRLWTIVNSHRNGRVSEASNGREAQAVGASP